MTKNHFIIPIFVPHEGCPHNCVFCNQNSITGNNVIKVDAEYVKNIVEEYLKTIPKNNRILEISFFGGTFTAIDIKKQIELLEVAKYYKDLGIINFIRLSTRPDYINIDILSNLKKFSVDIIELGVQSLDMEVLIKSGRGHNLQDVIEASNLIKKFGFTLGHQIMIGLPGDNFDKDIKTIKKLIEISPDICRIYPALVIKNTPMELMYNKGEYKPYTLEETIYITKILYGMLIAAGINIIRIGLQPTKEINIDGDIVSGPFHPAFRELIEGSILNDIIKENIILCRDKEFIIHINSKDISKLYCNKKIFFNDTKRQFTTINIKVIQNNQLNRGEIILECKQFCKKTSIYEYALLKYKEGF
ncbi:elongator complex protein 3 [Clostridium prolinivorans]|uniref:elongator complex protein 3 n=1 Tax=Clostridium prolinivorans TaxID=2769420 RepID=UPI000FDAA529|nr:radical SAM protein [Clostridium prolinivorans]